MRRLALALTLTLPVCSLVSCLPDPGVTLPDGGTGLRGGGSGGSNVVGNGSGGQGPGSGGVIGGGSGGGPGSGGSATGGRTGTGGVTGATGGRTGTGGVGTGGAATGGRGGTGGVTGSGGAGTGGRVGTGGAGTGGAGTGGSGTGGAQATSCVLPNHTGSGAFTHYDFGQGTQREGNGFRTACGYFGTEAGSVNLPDGAFPTDTVPVIGSIGAANAMYFAAIPGTNGFDTRNNCGACVQITGQNGRSVIATIIDECPYGGDGANQPCSSNPTGELDLSTALFGQLGYSVGNPQNTTWRFVACPVTGNVVMQVKTGNNNEIFIYNTPLAIKSVTRGGETAIHRSYGAWSFGTALNVGDTLTLTDALNRVLAVQVKSTAMNVNQDAGIQFASCQ